MNSQPSVIYTKEFRIRTDSPNYSLAGTSRSQASAIRTEPNGMKYHVTRTKRTNELPCCRIPYLDRLTRSIRILINEFASTCRQQHAVRTNGDTSDRLLVCLYHT